MGRESRYFDALLTYRPRGIPVQVNYLFLGHLLLWCLANAALESSRMFGTAQVFCVVLQSGILGVWVGAGRRMLIPRAVIIIIAMQLVFKNDRNEELDVAAYLVFAVVATSICIAESFGFRFAFVDADSELPQPAHAQFSLKQIFAVTTGIAILLSLTRGLQSGFGSEVWIFIVLLLADCAATFALCATVLSSQHWLSRSLVAIVTALLAVCATSLVLMSFQSLAYDIFFIAIFWSGAWLFAMFVTLAVLRSGGYRFGRFVSDESPQVDSSTSHSSVTF